MTSPKGMNLPMLLTRQSYLVYEGCMYVCVCVCVCVCARTREHEGSSHHVASQHFPTLLI